MPDPQTTNIQIYQPTHNSDIGTWDQPANANFGAADSLAANVWSISQTSGAYTFTTGNNGLPPNAGSLWSGPYGTQSAMLRFSGTLVGNLTVTLPRSGFWMIDSVGAQGAFVIFLQSAEPGKIITAPPGEIVHIFNDGVDCKYLDMGRVGSYMDLAASAVPAWITNCTVHPYLNCDGTTFSAATYPALNAFLGSTTLPDFRGRGRVSLDQGQSRITTAGGGVDGTTLFAGGGTQNRTITQSVLPAYNLAITDPGHQHIVSYVIPSGQAAGPGGTFYIPGSQINTQVATTGITVNLNGGGAALQTMTPVAVHGLTLIRAA